MLTVDLLKDALSIYQDKSEQEVHDFFISKGYSIETVGNLIQEVKKFHYLKRRKRGIQILGVGCVFLLIGFVLTVLMYHQGGGFDFVMYSFSIIGICCLLWGMVDFLGW